MFEGFVVNVLAEASKNPEVRALLNDLLSQAIEELKEDLLPDLMAALVPLIPKFIDAGLKQVFELLPNIPNIPEAADIAKGVVEKVLATDPDIPGLSNIIDLSQILRGFLR
jgi:hypothetical protein